DARPPRRAAGLPTLEGSAPPAVALSAGTGRRPAGPAAAGSRRLAGKAAGTGSTLDGRARLPGARGEGGSAALEGARPLTAHFNPSRAVPALAISYPFSNLPPSLAQGASHATRVR